MKTIGITLGKAAVAAVLLLGTAVFASAPAKADVGVGISFGYDGGYFSDPCDYYDYYDQAPPWGLPPDYCEYPVYFDPVYADGSWYRGPIYYRWYGGERMYWLNGGWRRDQWRGARPSSIRWTDRGGWHGRGGWNSDGRGGWNTGGHGGWGQHDGRGEAGRDGWNRGGGDRGDGNRGGHRGGDNSAYQQGGFHAGGYQGGVGGWSGGHGGGHAGYHDGGNHGGGSRGGWSGGNNGDGGHGGGRGDGGGRGHGGH